MNDILIKQFMKSFELTRLKAGLIQSAFYLGYFAVPIPSALFMRRFGFKAGLVTGILLYATGTFLFCEAARRWQYGFLLVALFVIACGASCLETGSNSFVVLLGDPRTSERRLNLSQSFNPLGAVTGVIVGTIFVFSGVELNSREVAHLKAAHSYESYLRHETLRVVPPYLVMGIILLIWVMLILAAKFPQVAEGSESPRAALGGKGTNLLQNPHFVRGVVAQFLYVAAQIGTWSYFIQYVQDYTHQSEKFAGFLLTGTLALFTIGRFTATHLMKFVPPNQLLGIYGLASIALVATGIAFPGRLGVGALFLTSFFKSPMFPTIFALGVKGLGPRTKLAGSIMVMAIVGGACSPPAMGYIFRFTQSMAAAMVVPLVCYMFIPYFAWYGSRV